MPLLGHVLFFATFVGHPVPGRPGGHDQQTRLVRESGRQHAGGALSEGEAARAARTRTRTEGGLLVLERQRDHQEDCQRGTVLIESKVMTDRSVRQ